MRLTIPGKIFAGFAALILGFGAVSGYAAWQFHALGRQVARIHETLVPLPLVLGEIRNHLRVLDTIDLTDDAPDHALLRRTVHVARRVHRSLERLADDFVRARALLAAPDAPIGTTALARHFAVLDADRLRLTRVADRFFDLVEREDADGSELAAEQRQLHRRVRDLGRQIARFEVELSDVVDRAVTAFSDEERRAVWASVGLTALAVMLGLAITWSAGRILRPLRTLREGVARIARGEPAEPVAVIRRDGLGMLTEDFNRMAEAIRGRDARLREQQKELLQRERLATVGRMSAQITHELRNPLSSIGLNSELLMEELGMLGGAGSTVEEMRSLLVNIIREVERLREITEEYLTFARRPRPEPTPVDLNHAAQELLDFLEGEMARSEVKTRLDADPAARPALADPNQLRAALINLLRNAREALEPQGGGHVVLRARTLGDHATIEVIDDGPGMSSAALEHLFEPFFSTKPQGTGLGLSLVRNIIEAQRGEVTVDSAPGRGTTVRISLPLAGDSDADEGA